MANIRSDEDRRNALAALVHADVGALRDGLGAIGAPAGVRTLRGPETGLVMVEGRTGGGGAPFNLGEASMTRCVVALACGTVGFGHVLGRDGEKARLIATLDALGETEQHAAAVAALVARLAAEQAEAARQSAADTAATRVEFFTMAREND